MTNKKLAQELKALGDLLVVAGQDEAKAARYARLAYTVSRLSEEVETLCDDGRLCDIPGVGPATAALISELLMTGFLPDAARLGAARAALRAGTADHSRHRSANGAASVSGLWHCQHCRAGAGRTARRHHRN